jgi:hypothetical protein
VSSDSAGRSPVSPPSENPDAGADDAAGADAADGSTVRPAGEDRSADDAGFGRRGWVLVAVVVVSTLLIPGVLYLAPTLLPSLGVPYVVALLVLPLVPAGLLGATAVWSMAASGRR